MSQSYIDCSSWCWRWKIEIYRWNWRSKHLAEVGNCIPWRTRVVSLRDFYWKEGTTWNQPKNKKFSPKIVRIMRKKYDKSFQKYVIEKIFKPRRYMCKLSYTISTGIIYKVCFWKVCIKISLCLCGWYGFVHISQVDQKPIWLDKCHISYKIY